ncbi:MAG: hypothetical protein A2V59_00555 [Armatimonadetes bacterium RBG_19FT_COMBO_69_19]|nr:MAG: hypothetical protein A2V59_00555 [Armatimonadetes bacterium RBG_19FT_COMBO_69_19]
MSVRAVAVRNGPGMLSAPAVALHGARPVRSVPRARRHVHAALGAAWGRFADDHRLIRFKLLLLGIMVLAAMALEVPW